MFGVSPICGMRTVAMRWIPIFKTKKKENVYKNNVHKLLDVVSTSLLTLVPFSRVSVPLLLAFYRLWHISLAWPFFPVVIHALNANRTIPTRSSNRLRPRNRSLGCTESNSRHAQQIQHSCIRRQHPQPHSTLFTPFPPLSNSSLHTSTSSLPVTFSVHLAKLKVVDHHTVVAGNHLISLLLKRPCTGKEEEEG